MRLAISEPKAVLDGNQFEQIGNENRIQPSDWNIFENTTHLFLVTQSSLHSQVNNYSLPTGRCSNLSGTTLLYLRA